MTPPVSANEMLAAWQLQRRAGIRAADRVIPSNDNADAFERQLETLRRILGGDR